MKLSSMQPDLVPYRGYFQLIHAVDNFVISGDVQYIQAGWINRNRILMDGEPWVFTFGLKKAPHTLNINERYFSERNKEEKANFIRTIDYAYKKAPCYDQVAILIEEIFANDERNVSRFITKSMEMICAYLGIKTKFSFASDLPKDNSLKRMERVLDINRCFASDHFINPIGGVALYPKEVFADHGVKLNFIKMRDIQYKQFDAPFVPSLSIIDVMMFNSVEEVGRLLGEYDLV